MAGGTGGLDELYLDVRHEQQRLALYRAKVMGSRPTTPTRLHELERACERAEARLAHALTQTPDPSGSPR